jgi:dipeptidyl aminopeptidase/acylaminoacyl peptidase
MADMPIDGGLFLASVHINPEKFCRTREKGYHTISFKRLPKGEEVRISALPDGTIIHAAWYPTGDKVLIFNRESDGVYLYSAALTDGVAKRISNRRINTTARKFVLWVNDTDFITACVVEEQTPPTRHLPTGPIVQESLGKKNRKWTIQGYLRDEFDQEAFKHYFTSQLVRISSSGEKLIGSPAIYLTISISPNREYLMIYRVVEPYSYEAKFMGLKSAVTIENLEGEVIKKVKSRGNLSWRADKPATIVWTVKAKKDNPDYKHSVYQQAAPFTEERQLVIRTPKAFERIYWSKDNFAMVAMKDKKEKVFATFDPSKSESKLNTLVSYKTDDFYDLPNEPIMVMNEYDRKVLWTNDKNEEILFTSKGYTPEGRVPKLLLYKVGKEGYKVVWRSKAPFFEDIIAAVSPAERIFVTSRESFEEPKNYYLSNLKKRSRVAITEASEPYPSLKGVKREYVTYKRADGVELKSFVYLPAGYNPKRDGKLPIPLWAYPRTAKSADIASSRPKYSLYSHLNLASTGGSMLFWLTQGYCVMEAMDMPLIPTDGNKNANDSFVKQLVMNAEAAIEYLDKAGYGDPNRVGVGGHSYGSFMTANLLSHTKLFKAGIALSGAFNRSLTPYGFQNEKRNYWGANKLYRNMSPFEHANKLNGAILLIHGGKDENTGTHTIQSERYFQALRGHNKYVRYVELPLDGHQYFIRENVLHYLYEANLWLEKYVKNGEPTEKSKAKKPNNND